MDDSTISDVATFNMKAVVRETGLKPDTLRAWERRYGLPQPQRSTGGHRLYTERDIETVKWLIIRQEEGLSISRAVDLWKQLESGGQNPLEAMPIAGARKTITPMLGMTMDRLRDDWIAACKAFDELKAEQVLNLAFAMYPPESVCTQVLMKSLSEVGNEWYRGNITVQQEHFASELAIRRLETLLAASPSPTLPGRILILCPKDEDHTFSPLLLTYLLRRNGRSAIFLGSNVPLEYLQETIANIKPQLIILTAQQLYTAANLLHLANVLKEHPTHLAYGGRVFNIIPAIQDRIPGQFLGEDLELAPNRVARLLSHTPSPPRPIEAPTQTYQETQQIFRTRLAGIDGRMLKIMESIGIPYYHLTIANLNMARNINAALSLGDISLLGNDIEWVEGLLLNRGIPGDLLKEYITAYADVTKKEMDDHARIITDYLISLLNKSE
jgi:DNA-binding transcriptional MerR regulator